MTDPGNDAVSPVSASREYVVVARRYRPQAFDDLVGQSMVTQALRNAITTDRVGHAYLFTGARGVGKTSTARILAKALNCSQGPTPTPCGHCDICAQITTGEDVDVLEIDGASNRGIDEIRQLRSNVGIRPSRSRFKVYIIDEVHMLTKEAFNALLKTLEEPPEHVKFIFCTTEPGKIPITVLSRCQRFDFAPVGTAKIVERLQYIVQQERAAADLPALQLLARRAAGSMRDSQSLLEQLLSFVNGPITVDDVHTMLGTARDDRLQAMIHQLVQRDAAASLAELDRALTEGVDSGQLTEQLLGGFRDMMAAIVGCPAELSLCHDAADWDNLRARAEAWGLETLMAAAQILDQALTRMRHSTQPRILLEIALVRIAHLENLDDLAQLVAGLRADHRSSAVTTAEARTSPAVAGAGPDVKKNARNPAASGRSSQGETSPAQGQGLSLESSGTSVSLTVRQGQDIWRAAIATLNDMTADFASHGECVAISGPNRLVVSFQPMYNSSKAFCERPERRETLEKAVSDVAQCRLKLDFELVREDPSHASPTRPAASRQQRQRQVASHPLVERAVELFEADVLSVDSASERRGN